MTADPTIRPAERRDLPTLGRLGAALVRMHHGLDPQRFLAPSEAPADGYARFLGSCLGEADAVVLVAEQDGAVIGYVYAGLEPHSWRELRGPAGFIHDVVVDEAARGRGVATALLTAAFGWLESLGAPRIVLMTAARNTAAQRLFERLGFRPTMIEMTRERGG